MLRALSILAKMPVMDLKKRGTSDSEKTMLSELTDQPNDNSI